ncbi:MAG: ankyrin repeat domain-containing protein [Proteobacteria bacterium]|nr:ankyrin repeat domain-containing protein [Pseudomonadota bacterium]
MKKIAYLVVAVGFISSAVAGSYDDFFSALRNDNASALQSLLQRGFDPNTRDPQGQPGLTFALREQSLKTAKVLIALPNLEVDAANQANETALMIAALKGDLDDAKALLDRGAQVNRTGWTPLHYAASGPDVRLVALMLDRGADIDAPSPNGTTPLMMAAQYGSEDSVKLLLARGADPKRRNQRELGAADFAKLGGRQGLATQLEALQR